MTSYQEADGATDGGMKGFSRYTSCLIPVIAAIVVLALGVTALNHLVDLDEPSATATTTDVVDDTTAQQDTEPTPTAASRPEGRYSSEGILTLLTTLGWVQFGELAHYELGGRTRQTRKYRKDDAQVSVTIHAFKSRRTAKQKAHTLGAERRRVRFDHKIVVVEALNKAAETAVPDLIESLEVYREMVRQ